MHTYTSIHKVQSMQTGEYRQHKGHLFPPLSCVMMWSVRIMGGFWWWLRYWLCLRSTTIGWHPCATKWNLLMLHEAPPSFYSSPLSWDMALCLYAGAVDCLMMGTQLCCVISSRYLGCIHTLQGCLENIVSNPNIDPMLQEFDTCHLTIPLSAPSCSCYGSVE